MTNEERNFTKLWEHRSTTNSNGEFQMRFSYSPTLRHSERFADLTMDKNPIHRELYEGETVMPAFLQDTIGIIASKKAMLECGINPADFPVSHNNVSLDNFVVSGLDYELVLRLRRKPLEVTIEIIDSNGKKVFDMNRTFEGIQPSEDYEKLIHSGSFNVTGQVLSQFADIVEAVSSESNLYSMASSSSVLFGAYDARKLPKLEEDVAPIYTGQEIYLDTRRSVRGGVDVLLRANEIPKGGLKRGDTLKIMASTWHKGDLINRIASEITFQGKKLPMLAVRKALRAKKRQV